MGKVLVVDDGNPYMEAITEHTVSIISTMKEGDLSVMDLKKIQNTFRAFDNLIDEAINEVADDLQKGAKGG